MKHLIEVPKFPPLPSTDSANVHENIDNWLDNKKQDRIDTFLRPHPNGYRGYFFVNSGDLEETREETRTVLGVELRIVFKRRVHTPDHFCPLYFTQLGVQISIFWGDILLEYRSEANLRRLLTGIKNDPYKGSYNRLIDYHKNERFYRGYVELGKPSVVSQFRAGR